MHKDLKNNIMSKYSDVLVSYQPGQFGDWLRYLISEHDGFEKFTGMSTEIIKERRDPPFSNFSFSDAKWLRLRRWNNVDELKYQFKKSNLRQVYKPKGLTHTILHNPENYQNGKFDMKYYDIARQTDLNIIFVKLNPLSELFETFIKRKINYDNGNILSEKELRHNCHMSYIHNEYPKHELNHVVEINNLADCEEEEYNKLTDFLKVKPMSDWKKYVKELETVIL